MRLVIVLACLSMIFSQGEVADADERAILSATADLIRDNKQKFPNGIIEFSKQIGETSSESEARAGQLHKLAAAKGRYRYDGGRRAFNEVRFSPEIMAASLSKTPTGTSSRVESFQSTTNGSLSVLERFDVYSSTDKSIYGSISVTLGAEQFYTRASVPINLGFPEGRPDYERHLRWAAGNENGFRLESWEARSVLDKKPCVYFHFRSQSLDEELWIDMEKGAIPVLIHLKLPNDVDLKIFNDEIQLIPGHGWLPLVQTVFVAQYQQVQRLVIESYDFDSKPSPDAFAITFLEPEPLLNPVTFAELPPAKTWNLDRLPASFTASRSVAAGGHAAVDARGEVGSGAANAQTRQPASEPLPGELATPPTSPWAVGAIVAVVLATSGGILWFWRHRRRA